MLVYRVENESGLGPYNPGDDCSDEQHSLSTELLYAHADDDHPLPWDDDLATPTGTVRSACPSRQALAAWFAGYGRALTDAGFRVVVYRVESVERGASGKQVVFARYAAARLATFTPAALIP